MPRSDADPARITSTARKFAAPYATGSFAAISGFIRGVELNIDGFHLLEAKAFKYPPALPEGICAKSHNKIADDFHLPFMRIRFLEPV